MTALLVRVAVLMVAAVAYIVAYQWVYGGWTVYASGDQLVDGRWLVVVQDPNYLSRSRRLIGLPVDRGFGLAGWKPLYLAVPMSLIAFARRQISPCPTTFITHVVED